MTNLKSWVRSQLSVILLNETQLLITTQYLLNRLFPLPIYQMASILGTHSFYLTILPLFFWIYFPTERDFMDFGLEIILNLGIGVVATCYCKDYLSLPRPQSPSIKRISVAKYHSKEFGCPSTHAANATSIALFLYEWLAQMYKNKIPLNILILLYSVTFLVISSRIALGMHGFLDLSFGILIGLGVEVGIQKSFSSLLEFLETSSIFKVHFSLLVLLFLVIHFQPVPESFCPCYLDSICFSSVVIGVLSARYFSPKIINGFGLQLESVSKFSVFIKRMSVGLMVLLSWKRFWGRLRKVFQNQNDINRGQTWNLETIILIINYCGIGFLSTAVLPFLLSIMFP